MPIIPGNYQNIIVEPIISLRLGVVEKASYSVQFNLIGINGLHGFGNWTASFTGILNELGCPVDAEFPLAGTGSYQARGCPSISSFIGNLQINVTYPPATPLPTRDPTETIWKGTVTLTGGCIIGMLSRDKGDIRPSLYNIKASYNMQVINGISTLSIKNMTIQSQ